MLFIVKKTLAGIIESGNDYLVKVKRNEPALLRAMERIKKTQVTLSHFIQREINRGRKETRFIKIYKTSSWISSEWPGAKAIVYLERRRQNHEGIAITVSYYLSSLCVSAQEFARGVRHHWGIENRLHYVKDVTFKEDESRIRSGHAPAVFSLIRSLSMNIARLQGENRIKRFLRRCAGNVKLIYSYLE